MLDFKKRHRDRVQVILGNHDLNRLGFVRDNFLIEQGNHPKYSEWLATRKLKDSTLNRVTFWGSNAYGVNEEGVPPPLAQYRSELTRMRGSPVSLDEAAMQFARDLKVGLNGEPHGPMLQYILGGSESIVIDSSRVQAVFTHAPITVGSLGVIPNRARVSGGASWLIEREKNFQDLLKQFVRDIRDHKAPSSILVELGDARYDNVGQLLTTNADSLTYTERPMQGEQFFGVDDTVAKTFINDPEHPVRMLFSGHKPAGNYPTVHAKRFGGQYFFDVAVDTSRGPNGIHSTLVLEDDGNLAISGTTFEAKVEHWVVDVRNPGYLGKIAPDGFHIKGQTSDGKYIMEKYSGYSLVEKIAAPNEIDLSHTTYSSLDAALDKTILKKEGALKAALRNKGITLVSDFDALSRILGDRFVLDLRGSTSWTAFDDQAAERVRNILAEMAVRLDPKNVVVMTGGNRVENANALENMVLDVFGDPSRKFQVIGIMKYDTPANEIDSAVKYILLNSEGDNWDGPVKAAQEFVYAHNGACVYFGGGKVLERTALNPTSAKMKDRMLMFQGYGGTSEKVFKEQGAGTAVSDVNELMGKLRQINPKVIHAHGVGLFIGARVRSDAGFSHCSRLLRHK
jgi:hypothetical protein